MRPLAATITAGLPGLALLLGGFVACAAPAGPGSRPEDPPSAPSAPILGTGLATVDADLAPALEALEQAVSAGDDGVARDILDRLMLLDPRGRALDLARSYAKILDGRALVSSLHLALVTRAEPPEPGGPSEPREDAASSAGSSSGARVLPDGAGGSGARHLGLYLSAENAGLETFDLVPGPATLHVEHSSVDARGNEEHSVETHTFEKLELLRILPGALSEIRLAHFFLAVPRASLAVRLTFDLELRSGGVKREQAELPAMRLGVTESSAVRLCDRLEAQGPSAPGDLAALAQRGRLALDEALELAVRVPFGERTAALEALRPIAPALTESDMQSLVPSLRWLSRTGDPGGDPDVWRAWLRSRGVPRSHGSHAPRERAASAKLVLPGGER